MLRVSSEQSSPSLYEMPYSVTSHAVNLREIHHANPHEFPYLLESVAHNEKIGRYDILLYRPSQTMALEHIDQSDFLTDFDKQWQAQQQYDDGTIPQDIPFRGGWFIFLAYELAEQIEPRLSLSAPPHPIAYAARCGAALIADHLTQKTYVVADNEDPALLTELERYLAYSHNTPQSSLNSITIREDDEQQFIDGVEKSRQYIIDGDVFQVNLSRGWSFDMYAKHSAQLYSQLCEANPAPFATSCNITHNDSTFSIISSSPERLISIRNGVIETRPIAGTRPRGDNAEEDAALAAELIAHIKERAEHIMLIDLERNDLGRICQPGSVTVDELMVIESYAHVHHIVSNVTGIIRQGITPADALRAVFPGGTITGCPKLRCMEIIHELEQTYRGAYTGSVGYINHNGDMDTNILIRTFSCHNDRVEFRAGAGIVYDSIASNELQETRNKAKGLLRAL